MTGRVDRMEGVIGSIVSKIDTVSNKERSLFFFLFSSPKNIPIFILYVFSVNQRILFFIPRQKTFQYSCVYIFYVLVKLESMEDNDLDYNY